MIMSSVEADAAEETVVVMVRACRGPVEQPLWCMVIRIFARPRASHAQPRRAINSETRCAASSNGARHDWVI
ncbi:unnamed protein product [Mycetohabitans rhizoxinica HKI 454]|uniref:Uncharacterized protein n=1 Tax=Mycetohabitans rhizoxinica (strain DSM 19002 / CIP 109453 / HKI 454) TaxID=882378 RepID=E5AQQ8_MYCRK|nr:unnamed protein product [Mycetohabitans rhizoxinica HKI 454]